MSNKTLTPEGEEQAIRDYLNAQQRAWWNKQTPEQRRERRLRYQLNMMRRAEERENEATEERSNESISANIEITDDTNSDNIAYTQLCTIKEAKARILDNMNVLICNIIGDASDKELTESILNLAQSYSILDGCDK